MSSGDSLVRVLLTARPLQAAVASLVLETVLSISTGADDATGGGAMTGASDDEDEGPGRPQGLASLLLSQFHCLDATFCGDAVVDMLLEVFNAASATIQTQVAGIIAEMAPVSRVPGAHPA